MIASRDVIEFFKCQKIRKLRERERARKTKTDVYI